MLVDCSFYDESIGQREAKRLQRPRKANFDFVQEGRFSRMAELQRIRVSTLQNVSPVSCWQGRGSRDMESWLWEAAWF